MMEPAISLFEKFSFDKVTAHYNSLLDERSEWETEWRNVSDFILPGRGVYTGLSKPAKRKLTTPKVINTVAEDALYVLTSGMHGGLTSPSRAWFSLEWMDQNIQYIEILVGWLQECESRLHTSLHSSNFYSIINSFYTEYAGFGTGCIYLGEDTGDALLPFHFELLTAGEYVFSTNTQGRADTFFRVIFMTPRQLVERFPETVNKETKDKVEKNESGIDQEYVSVLECVYPSTFQDKPFTRLYYESQSSSDLRTRLDGQPLPLEVAGFYEFPYPLARWGTIGSDVYGIGPGSRALPDVRRLQEMEKAFLMATHKSINPPVNAPARMRGKLNTLPGGYNYYANPAETVNEIYQVRFDYTGVSAAVERVEQRIQRNFFNDIFLTGSRNPNATPYKATEVNAREQEKMLRLGPVIERLQHEFLQPIIERCFNIMLRKQLFPVLPPELADLVGEFKISLISPLATAQRSVALNGINSFMGFLGNAAQFDPTILDNINSDAAAREFADITGVNLGILRPSEEVMGIRKQRAEAQARQQQKEEAMAMAGMGAQAGQQNAQARKTSAEAGLLQLEGQQIAEGMGVV